MKKKIILLLSLLIALSFTQPSALDICTTLDISTALSFRAGCGAEIASILPILTNDLEAPELRLVATCNISCVTEFSNIRKFSACVELVNALAVVEANVTLRIALIRALDARCIVNTEVDPPRVKIVGDIVRLPCPLAKRAAVRLLIQYVIGNCTAVPFNSTADCNDNCLRALVALSRDIHDCRDEHRFLDEVIHPLIRRRFRLIHRFCELRRRLANTADECKDLFLKVYNYVRTECGTPIANGQCPLNCLQAVRRAIGALDRCGSFFRVAANTTGNLPPFDIFVRDFLRRVRFYCSIDSRRVEVDVTDDEAEVDINAEDSLRVDRPRTRLRLITRRKLLEWIAERYDRFIDTNPAKRFRMRLRKLHEFRCRNDTDTDPDFVSSGFDPNKDSVVASYDFEADSDVDAVSDLGSIDIYDTTGNTSFEATSWRRLHRLAVRYGPNRISRFILSMIYTHIRNGLGDGEVSVPGSTTFNLVFENVPYKANDSSIALEFDLDLDSDEGTLETNSTVTRDPDGVQLLDDTEGRITFTDNRRIRWKRRVFCDGAKEVIVRVRIVTSVTESPDGGFVIRKKVFVTFHISRSIRCLKLTWDPSTDVAPDDDVITPPTTTAGTTTTTTPTTTTTTPTTGVTTTNTRTSSSSKLIFAIFLLVVAVLF